MLRFLRLLAFVCLILPTVSANANGEKADSYSFRMSRDEREIKAIIDRAVESGAPRESLERITKFIRDESGRELSTDVYICSDSDPRWKDPTGVRPCRSEKYRTRTTRMIRIEDPRFVSILNLAQPSNEKRFYVVDLKSGETRSFYGTHGRASGQGRWAARFSNDKDSNMTSLGLFKLGETYFGGHGVTIRMYGLERSNDRAYHRDIVMHGAWYADEKFINGIDPKTKQKRDRLGLSWGCPAVSDQVMKELLPILKGQSIMDIYHPTLIEAAQSGRPVAIPDPDTNRPFPSLPR